MLLSALLFPTLCVLFLYRGYQMSTIKLSDQSKYLTELLSRQLTTVSQNKKLLHKDMSRMAKYINKSIFLKTGCCEWMEYVTNISQSKKRNLFKFFLQGKKSIIV